MRFYESVFIARQDISTSQVTALCDEFEKIIADGGGKILKKEYWGLKTLAYRIKKNRKGHYVMFNMEADSATMDEYGRRLGLNEDVLRVLTIKIDAVDDEPSIMMQSKSDRDGRTADESAPDESASDSRADADESKHDSDQDDSAPDADDSAPEDQADEDNASEDETQDETPDETPEDETTEGK